MELFSVDTGKRGSATVNADQSQQTAVQDEAVNVVGTGNTIQLTDGEAARVSGRVSEAALNGGFTAARDVINAGDRAIDQATGLIRGAINSSQDTARLGADLSARFIADAANARRNQAALTADLARVSADGNNRLVEAGIRQAAQSQSTARVFAGEVAQLAGRTNDAVLSASRDALSANRAVAISGNLALRDITRNSNNTVLQSTRAALDGTRSVAISSNLAARDISRQSNNLAAGAIDTVANLADRNAGVLSNVFQGALSFAGNALQTAQEGFDRAIDSNAQTTASALTLSRDINSTPDENIARVGAETTQGAVQAAVIGFGLLAAAIIFTR